MVVIRLARMGRNKYPVYRIVAADKRRSATSKFLAILGHYNPHTKEIVLKKEEINAYMAKGAQASDRVLRLLKAEGVSVPKWAETHDRFKKPKKEAEETTEPTEATPESAGEVATAEAESVSDKADAKKEDVGTAAEKDEQEAEVEAQEKAGDAAIETAQEQQANTPEEPNKEEK